MKLNLTRRVLVPLSREKCLQELEALVNDKSNHYFRFPVIGRYSLKLHGQKRFNIAPSFFRRGPVVEGFIEDDIGDSSTIYIRLMPPIWLFFVFGLFPLLMVGFLASDLSVQGWFIGGIWFLFWIALFYANILCSLKLFKAFDVIFQSLDAEHALPEPFYIKRFFRKLGIYLLVSVIYILGLIMLGLIMSNS